MQSFTGLARQTCGGFVCPAHAALACRSSSFCSRTKPRQWQTQQSRALVGSFFTNNWGSISCAAIIGSKGSNSSHHQDQRRERSVAEKAKKIKQQNNTKLKDKMEDEDIYALMDTDAAVKPYLNVLTGVSDAGTVRTMVLKSLSDPQMFCGYDQIQAACGSHLDDKTRATLELFSFGTYADYVADTSKFLPLNDTHIFKLRQLTILSCVHQALGTSSSITYEVLEQALQCPLEPVIIPCLYSQILNGKLCQKTKRFLWTVVPPCISRDVPLSNLDNMLATLTGLQQRLQLAQGDLNSATTVVSENLEKNSTYMKSIKERTKKAQAQAKSSGGVRGGPIFGAGPDGGPGAASRRSSASRQSKRSRGGLGGSYSSEPFQRY